MENSTEKNLTKNAGLIDALFCLLYKTLWVAPYDRRRTHPALDEFERCVRRMVRDLCSPDVPETARDRSVSLMNAAEEIGRCFERVAATGIFPADLCAEAAGTVAWIREVVCAMYSEAGADGLPYVPR